MKKMKKLSKITAIILALVLTLSLGMQAFAATPAEMSASLSTWLKANVKVADTPEDELDGFLDWTVFALSRAGITDLNADYAAYIEKAAAANAGNMDLAAYARLALTRIAAGQNPRNIGGVNAISKILNTRYDEEVFTAPLAYALMALGSRGYFAISQRLDIIDILLASQRANGGFNYALVDDGSGFTTDGDVDTTAIVLQALAPYYRYNNKVTIAVNDALAFIKSETLPDGGYGFFGMGSAETTAQVLTALCELKIDPLSSAYISSEGKNMIDALSTYINPDGGGRSYDGSSNIMTSYQMLMGVTAYDRYQNGSRTLFNITDATGSLDLIFATVGRIIFHAIFNSIFK